MKNYAKLLRPLGSVLVNLLLAYVVYFVARIAFLLENLSLYPDLSAAHLLELLRGGLTFDTSAILYTNALWVVMVLFPLHLKETRAWHRACRCTFVVVNTLCLAVNLGDSVYFRFATRRTTTTIFQEFENEGNLGDIFLTEAVSHWYFFLLAAVVAWGLWRLYREPVGEQKPYKLVTYYLVMTLSLLAFAPFCVAGMRGGWTRDIRPITISNANNYCDRPTEAGIVLNTPFSLIRTIGKNNFEVTVYFDSKAELESVFNPINIFVPLMGEDKKEHLKLVYDTFHPKEVCPVLPFPSKEPGRSDQLLWEYNDFLTDTLKVEPQNLLYAPERDPFELYNRLEKLMQDYKDTLKLIDGQICFGFALLTSKLLALGVLLIGLKYEDEVQVYNVNSSKYDIADKKKIIEANEHSEPFLMWINGEPYV